jgi:hypothetical protein
VKDESGVVVIHCSDPRFQPHFQDFLRKALGIEHYALIAVPGGAQFLTLADYLPKFSWAGWRWLKFVMGMGSPERVILIAHEDCRWYLDQRFWPGASSLREKQLRDVAHVRRELAERFARSKVESYYARVEKEQVVFEAL